VKFSQDKMLTSGERTNVVRGLEEAFMEIGNQITDGR
jgi:hypothetical protein